MASSDLRQWCAETWWMAVLRGILLIALGVYAVQSPVDTAVAFVWVLGLFAVIDGVLLLLAAAVAKKRWWVDVLLGAIYILAGGLVLAHPLFSAFVAILTLVYIIGVLFMFAGFVGMAASFMGAGFWRLLAGIFLMLLGALILMWPANVVLFGYMLILLLGICAMISGLATVIMGFHMRTFANESFENSG